MKPCIVIPIYNNHDTIGDVVDRLAHVQVPCIVVNDGSNEQTRQVLRELEESRSWVEVVHRDDNGGKGAAVKTGLLHASSQGFSHALQVDADGQHQLEDVPAFLQEAREHRDALVLGAPVFGSDVPKSRLYGRMISRFWVWVETLSKAIKDPLFGFRVYPLQSAQALLASTRMGDRMDFDPEIAVRMYWHGVPIRNLDTEVIYPEDGISNFKMVADNLRISWLHTRLVLGMLLRIPRLLRLRRRAKAAAKSQAANATDAKAEAKDWGDQKERGSLLGIRFLLFILNLLGQRLVMVCVTPVVLYFYLTSRAARRASRDYLDRLNASGESPVGPASFWNGFRHQLQFAEIIVERFLLWQGKLDKFKFNRGERSFLHDDQGKGVLLVGAHMGSFDALRTLSQHYGIAVTVVMDRANARRINKVLSSLSPNSNLRVIEMRPGDVGAVFDLKERVDRGEVVAILGDRFPRAGRPRVTRVQFCGDPAPFPQNVWILASLLKCPVYVTVALRVGYRNYHIHFEKLVDEAVLPRKRREEGLRELIEGYAACLEKLCRKAPLQWFNFYDFWSLHD